MDKTSEDAGGLLPTLLRMLKTLGGVVENRVELLIVEYREERLRVVEVLCLLMIGTVCALIALLLITLAVLVVFWETHPLLVIAAGIVVYGGGAAAAFGRLRSRLQRWRAFEATLEEFKKDQACFKERN